MVMRGRESEAIRDVHGVLMALLWMVMVMMTSVIFLFIL